MSVTNGNDSGPGSLRQAIIDTPSGGIIIIDPELVGPITLDSTIVINKSLIILSYTDQIITPSITGVFDLQLFNCTGGSIVTFNRIAFQGNPGVDVGAIRSIGTVAGDNTSLALEQCSVTNFFTTASTNYPINVRNAHVSFSDSTFNNNSGNSGPLAITYGLPGFETFLFNCAIVRCEARNNNYSNQLFFLVNSGFSSSRGNINGKFISNVIRDNTSGNVMNVSMTSWGPLGTVTAEDCVCENNECAGFGATMSFLSAGPGLSLIGRRIIFRNNTFQDLGYLIFRLNDDCEAEISECLIDSNTGIGGGTSSSSRTGLLLEGNISAGTFIGRRRFKVENCTISNNTIVKAGTPEAPAVSGLITSGRNITAEIANVTISNNVSEQGVGGFALVPGSAAVIDQNVTLRNCTIVENVGPFAGGISVYPGMTLIMFNALVGNNYATPARSLPLDITGTVDGASFYNLVSVNTGMTGITNGTQGNQIGTAAAPIDPLIGPLGDYGGSNGLQVIPLLEGSPAINAGGNAYVVSTYDERGSPYVRIWSETGSPTVDIGAFEFQPFVLPCYIGESILRIRELATGKIKYLQAKEIYSDKHEVYDMESKCFIPVKYNAVMQGADTVYKIAKDSLGENQPSEDFFITSGHPICIEGKPVKARDVPGAERIEIEKADIYSIVCTRWKPIDVNGIGVYAWSEHKWTKHVQKEGIVWRNNQ